MLVTMMMVTDDGGHTPLLARLSSIAGPHTRSCVVLFSYLRSPRSPPAKSPRESAALLILLTGGQPINELSPDVDGCGLSPAAAVDIAVVDLDLDQPIKSAQPQHTTTTTTTTP